jgi:hypothetical protein
VKQQDEFQILLPLPSPSVAPYSKHPTAPATCQLAKSLRAANVLKISVDFEREEEKGICGRFGQGQLRQ